MIKVYVGEYVAENACECMLEMQCEVTAKGEVDVKWECMCVNVMKMHVMHGKGLCLCVGMGISGSKALFAWARPFVLCSKVHTKLQFCPTLWLQA